MAILMKIILQQFAFSAFVEALTLHNLAQWVTIFSSHPTAIWKQIYGKIQSHFSDNNLQYTFQNINQNTTPPQPSNLYSRTCFRGPS